MTGSLRTRVVTLSLVALAAVLLPLAIIGYFVVREEVEELCDARLAQNARTLGALARDAATTGGAPIRISAWHASDDRGSATVRGHAYETQVGFQIWKRDGGLLAASDNLAALPLDATQTGFSDPQIGNRHWRTFTLLTEGGHWVRVGERYDSRREIARTLALQSILPVLVALPLLAMLVGGGVHRGMRPLRRLAELVRERRADAVEPLGTTGLPDELEPVVASLNGLLRRLREALENERAFTANAAHELRTPLAGALMQVENARASLGTPSAARALDDARGGLERLSHRVAQLLDLARWDAGQTQPMASLDLGACVEAELAGLGSAIADRDLVVDWSPPAAPLRVPGWEPGVRTLVRNLLDNAVRFNVPSGRLHVRVSRDDAAVRLVVQNDGARIDPPERARLFHRFQRGRDARADGSGIGLSLVARIAALHRAGVRLVDGDDGHAVRVEVDFPVAAG